MAKLYVAVLVLMSIMVASSEEICGKEADSGGGDLCTQVEPGKKPPAYVFICDEAINRYCAFAFSVCDGIADCCDGTDEYPGNCHLSDYNVDAYFDDSEWPVDDTPVTPVKNRKNRLGQLFQNSIQKFRNVVQNIRN